MDNRSKKLPNFGKSKTLFTPNLRYKRNVATDSDQSANVNVKIESDTSMPTSSTNSQTQKSKKAKEKSTTQVQSVFSTLSSSGHGSSGSHMGLSSGFRSYSNQGSFNNAGTFVKTETCQSIHQMFENNQLDVDDPSDSFHGPVRLPLSKKDRIPQDKSENSLEYPFQENVYPSLSELITPESLMVLQFFDTSFSSEPKITDIDLTKNGDSDTTMFMPKTDVPIKLEFNENNIKTENDSEANKPIGKVQYYRSGRVVLIFNGKEYELLKANEDKHHKELLSFTNIEAEKPDKLVSLGIIPLRLKAVMDIDTIIEQFLKNVD